LASPSLFSSLPSKCVDSGVDSFDDLVELSTTVPDWELVSKLTSFPTIQTLQVANIN